MSPKKKSNRTPIIVAIVAVVIAALAVALFVGGSDDADTNGSVSTGPVSTDGTSNGDSSENQPVDISGAALDPFVSANGDTAVGVVAPTLNGQSFDGTPVTVTPGDGRAYMVVFLAHWCPHCNAEIPQLIKWKEAGSVPEGLEVVGVSTSVASDRPNYPPSEWTLAAGWPWSIMADSAGMDAATAYGVTGFPFFTVIGEDGTVKVRVSGQVEADVLDQILAAALD
jgi:cytochrome c biogenesis protein CcmG, thiol:disulfide interchange protein DsbE